MLLFNITLRRISTHRWICHTCRRAIVYSSTSTSTPKKPPSSALRKLPSGPARTRFAPSPTGYLHLGSLRTALFNYLLAKATNGQFLLRIEDTDQKRTIDDAEERLCRDLRWAGLEWDEGPDIGGPYGPYKQSQRTKLYQEHAQKLLRSGDAYKCFCSPERLNALSKQQSGYGLPIGYDRTCTHLSAEESEDRALKGEPFVIRFRIPSSYPQFTDLVYGKIDSRRIGRKPLSNHHPIFEDLILIKSDGFPTYHLANVIDDHYMKISHVIRGGEWISSTPKHLALYNAFQWEPPAYAHVGLLTDQDGQKLSKRNLELDVSSYREKMGIFPETLMNFVALLGWSHMQGTDVMDLRHLVEIFDMKFTKGNTVVAFEKLWYLQRAHAEQYATSINEGNANKASLMTEPIMEELKRRNLIDGSGLLMARYIPEAHVLNLLQANARVYTSAPEFIDKNAYFFQTPKLSALLSSWPSLPRSRVPGVVTAPTINSLRETLSVLELIQPQDWTVPTIRTCINSMIDTCAGDNLVDSLAEQSDLSTLRKSWSKIVHQYIRWAIAACMSGPESALSMEILGREETLARFETLAGLIESRQVEESAGLNSEYKESQGAPMEKAG